ncbi:MAG: hypothetical protein OEW60_02055 [Thiovulaceae bacterium]|nr:hypothetical protein [Sulfurimonadaceae bacterium]
MAVVIVIGAYSYLQKEGAFKKEPSSTSISHSLHLNAGESEEDELVWPELEEAKVTITMDNGMKAKKILEYLFHEKLHDKAVRCHIKQAKNRKFIGCKDGAIVKDNYWELSTHDNHLALLTRSQSAIYIAKKFTYKELVVETSEVNEKVEKAFGKFFDER